MPAEPRAAAPMFVAPSWAEAHCVIPEGFRAGAPMRFYEFQLTYMCAFYLVRGDVEFDPVNPILGPAFVYSRGLMVGPQKVGKSPFSAAHVCLEGVGPSLFAGWAGKDDGYACGDQGCGCGWEYPYAPAEPMGMPRPSPLIQLTAVSEDQTGNIYDALRPMIEKGPLKFLMPKTGEEFIRLPGDGTIDTVTSNARSRLGQRVTFVVQTEVGLYTKRNGMVAVADTQYRNLAGMSGRASLESNAWDPSQHSIAQREYESKATDVYRYFRQPPKGLSFLNKAERRKIYTFVYPKDTRREHGGHLDITSIESEAVKMIEHDPSQAYRFFGNGLATGAGAAFDLQRWRDIAVHRPHVVPVRTDGVRGTLITLGFDGSKTRDHTALVGTEVASGYQWPIRIWRPGDHKGEVPVGLVNAAVDWTFSAFEVWGLYGDPYWWEDTISGWIGRYGKDRVREWPTNRPRTMALAVRSWNEAIRSGALSHCHLEAEYCAQFTEHVGNAFKKETGYQDDDGMLYTIEKERPDSPNKIDADVAAILSWEARNDAIAAGALNLELEMAAPFVLVSGEL